MGRCVAYVGVGIMLFGLVAILIAITINWPPSNFPALSQLPAVKIKWLMSIGGSACILVGASITAFFAQMP